MYENEIIWQFELCVKKSDYMIALLIKDADDKNIDFNFSSIVNNY